MKTYYYTCPRCGRTWKRFIPRKTMTCKFCKEKWKTKGRRGTRERYSFEATFRWLLFIALVIYGAHRVSGYFAFPESVEHAKNAKTESSFFETDETEDVEVGVEDASEGDVEEAEAAEGDSENGDLADDDQANDDLTDEDLADDGSELQEE